MLRYLARRIVLGLFTIWFVSMVSFAIIQLPPGDFVDAYIGRLEEDGRLPYADAAQQLRHVYGLDQPVYIQYFDWITPVVQGNFGESLEVQRPVADIIGDSIWLTVAVTAAAIVVTWMIAIPIGVDSGR